MDYSNKSLSELKKIAKSYGLTVGNIGKEKLIEKLNKYDSEKSALDALTGGIEDDFAVEEPKVKNVATQPKANIIESITDMVSDLEEDLGEDYAIDETIEKIGMDEEVDCMSLVFGGLTYISKNTGAVYKWHNIGAVERIKMSELVSMNNSKHSFLNNPWIILKDPRAVNYFRLTPTYEKVAQVNSLKALFNSNDLEKIAQTLDVAMKVNMRDVVISKVRTMYNNGSLTNVKIIRLLEEKLRFDLSDAE